MGDCDTTYTLNTKKTLVHQELSPHSYSLSVEGSRPQQISHEAMDILAQNNQYNDKRPPYVSVDAGGGKEGTASVHSFVS